MTFWLTGALWRVNAEAEALAVRRAMSDTGCIIKE
jgi:hypothetical protein